MAHADHSAACFFLVAVKGLFVELFSQLRLKLASSRLFLLQALIAHASETGSFDGGDQGLLNTFFDDWATKDIAKHLPFLYNMVATATYTYIPAYK